MQQYIFGRQPLIEAIKAGHSIEKVFLKKGQQGELFHELFTLIRKNNIPFQFVPIEKINRITRKNHQGVLALQSLIEYQDIEQIIPSIYENRGVPYILILDHITDVRNMGSVCRTAEGAGIHAIVVPMKDSAQINADAVKTSAGALHNIPLCRTPSIKDMILYLKNCGIQTIATSEKAGMQYYEIDYTVPTAVIMGAEDKGVSGSTIKYADKLVEIPMKGKIDSLNVSAATAVVLYEGVRQRLLGAY